MQTTTLRVALLTSSLALSLAFATGCATSMERASAPQAAAEVADVRAPLTCDAAPSVQVTGTWVGKTEDGEPWRVALEQRDGEVVAIGGAVPASMKLCGRKLVGARPASPAATVALWVTSDGCKLGGTMPGPSGRAIYVSATRDGGCASRPTGALALVSAVRPTE